MKDQSEVNQISEAVILSSISINQQHFNKCAWNRTNEEDKRFKDLLKHRLTTLKIPCSLELSNRLYNEGFITESEAVRELLAVHA